MTGRRNEEVMTATLAAGESSPDCQVIGPTDAAVTFTSASTDDVYLERLLRAGETWIVVETFGASGSRHTGNTAMVIDAPGSAKRYRFRAKAGNTGTVTVEIG